MVGTLTAHCRNPVDKTDKQADAHEVTDEERMADQLDGVKEAYRLSGHFLESQVIQEQTWALLSEEQFDAYAGLLAEATRQVNAARKKAKHLPRPIPRK